MSSSFVSNFGTALVRKLSPEAAHKATLRALSFGLGGRSKQPSDPVLKTTLFGMPFMNPVGLAAGFDKDALVPDAMLRLGLGFVEVGTLTPLAQPGNPKPRIFRLPEDGAVINRLGFNNGGHGPALKRLEKRARAGRLGVVGVNIGANKDSDDRINDYVLGVERFKHLADFFTVNISSPNTPGLRGLQDKDQLAALLALTADARGDDGPPLLLKVAPDLDEQGVSDIADLLKRSAFDGLIVSNTTIDRPASLQSVAKGEAGGLSGRPLFEPSTQMLRNFYQALDGAMPLIGVGGIASGADAYTKIKAGASLVELYSALTYGGPPLIDDIVADLAAQVKADGFTNVSDAVGADYK